MFSRNSIFFVAAIFIFLQISNLIDSYQGLANLTSYDNFFGLKDSRRYKRQDDGSCRLPFNRYWTDYKVVNQEAPYNELSKVPAYTVIESRCTSGYKTSPLAQKLSFCVNGDWTPPPLDCLRACTSLKSIKSTNVECSYEAVTLDNCTDPVEGTIAYLSCNAHYEETSIEINPVRLCRDGTWEPTLTQCHPICGQKRPSGVTTVIGGETSVIGDYPWHVGIYQFPEQDYLCGGSLIYPNIVVSAAHCFTNHEGVLFPSSNYVVGAGKYHRSLFYRSDRNSQFRLIKEIKISSRYKGRTAFQAYDIAIVILRAPFLLSIAVQPVCIELNEELPQLQLSLSGNGVVTGWGLTQEQGDLSDVLKEVLIPYIPFDKCYNEIPSSFRKFFTPDKICGGYLNSGTGVCGGDSGGGYVFNKSTTNRYFIKGVVSISPTTNETKCDSNQYSLYTSIAAHIQFVRNAILYNLLPHSLECKTEKCRYEIPEPEDIIEKGGCSDNYFSSGFYSCKDHRSLLQRLVNMVF